LEYTTGGYVVSSPAVAGGMVYIGSYDGDVYVFGELALPVRGVYVPVKKLELLAPCIGFAILLAVAVITVVYLKKRKRQ